MEFRKISIKCTWNEKKEKGTVHITFELGPKSLFLMPVEKVRQLQKLGGNHAVIDLPTLKQIKDIKYKHPKSIYAAFIYFQALACLNYDKEAKNLFHEMQDQFPQELYTCCIEAHYALNEKKYDDFLNSSYAKSRRWVNEIF